MPADDLRGQPELAPHLAHLVLEQLPQRLDQLPRQVGPQASNVMVRLDRDGGPALRGRGLDHVRVQRPLHQEPDVPPLDVPRRVLEHVDEGVPDAAALLLGVLDSHELADEALARVHDPEIAQVRPEGPLDLLALAVAQQAVVHEDARQPVADRAVHQRRRHGRIDAAREATDGPSRGTDALPDPLHLVVDEVARRPIGRAAADPEQEVVQDLATARCVGHLGVKQHAEDGFRFVLHRRDRRVRAHARHPEARRRLGDPVAVARPHRDRGSGLEPGEQPGCGRAAQRHLRPSVLALGRRRDLPPREVGDELHPVADAEDRDAELEQLRIGAGRARVEHRVGTARENDPLGGELSHELVIPNGRVDLAIDVRLAHPPRDQLGVLRSVVEDQDPVHAWYQVVGSSTSPRSRSSSVSRCRAR